LLILAVSTYSQDSARAIYTASIRVDSSTKEQLYSKAKSWFAKTFKSDSTMIRMDNLVVGELSNTGLIKCFISREFGRKTKIWVRYTLSVYPMDEKYTYEYAVIGMETPNHYDFSSKDYNYYLKKSYKGEKVGTSLVGDVEFDRIRLLASLEKQ
jgi:hypothetical protein